MIIPWSFIFHVNRQKFGANTDNFLELLWFIYSNIISSKINEFQSQLYLLKTHGFFFSEVNSETCNPNLVSPKMNAIIVDWIHIDYMITPIPEVGKFLVGKSGIGKFPFRLESFNRSFQWSLLHAVCRYEKLSNFGSNFPISFRIFQVKSFQLLVF